MLRRAGPVKIGLVASSHSPWPVRVVCALCFRSTRFAYSSSTSSLSSSLPEPTVLFRSNHVLAVNKPPGWQSVPNNKKSNDESISKSSIHNSNIDSKCLLSYLKYNLQAGGGSDGTFLLPLHRLDQPCSGVLLYGKTSKAASRIQSNWKLVQTQYLVVVPTDSVARMRQQQQRQQQAALDLAADGWTELQGILQPTKKKRRHGRAWSIRNNDKRGGWSVDMIPRRTATNEDNDSSSFLDHPPAGGRHGRTCGLHYRVLKSSLEPSSSSYSLLQVQTNQGSRHMIRALLACHGCPIAGDLRYGSDLALPDRSVALHARRLVLPPAEDRKIVLSLDQRSFQAPIPTCWEHFFGFAESSVLLEEDNDERDEDSPPLDHHSLYRSFP